MISTLRGAGGEGLERSCGADSPDWIRSRDLADGVQLLHARFAGHGFDRHRHDTYAIGLTNVGVQAFDYRPCPLPFVREPVTRNDALTTAIEAAFRLEAEPLAIDGLILRLAEALLDADPSCGRPARPLRLDAGALARARQFLGSETARVIRSSELEGVSGLTRYDLARQFRSAFGTSPYRYSLMRRLDRARAQLRRSRSLADVALATGFADQSHLSRMFKSAFGVTPARYGALAARPDAASSITSRWTRSTAGP